MKVNRPLDVDPLNQAKCVMNSPSAAHRVPFQAMEAKVQVNYPLSTSAWDTGAPHNFAQAVHQQLRGSHYKYSYCRVDVKQDAKSLRTPLSQLPNRTRPVVRRKQLNRVGCNGRDISKPASSGTSSPQSAPSPTVAKAGMNGSPGRYSVNGELNNAVVREPRMQLSSLLVDPNARTYHLDVIQHPSKAAEFGSTHTLSRLPLTPPIVVQLIVRDGSGNNIFPEEELPFLVAHLSLFSADGSVALDAGSSPGGTHRRVLYGKLVAEPQNLLDVNGKQCLFFVFSDVSIRWRGRYQLGISLMRLSCFDSNGGMSVTGNGAAIAQARTMPFEVVCHRDYVAAPVTGLTQCLTRQGVRL